MQLGSLSIRPANELSDLLAPSVKAMFFSGVFPLEHIGIASIDPDFSDTAAFCRQYAIPLENTVNCVVIEAERGDRTWLGACAVPATTKADVNGVIRRQLGARRASFAPVDEALKATGMEYGGISPIGLPSAFQLIIDRSLVSTNLIVIGSGIRSSKIILPGELLTLLPNVIVLDNVGKERQIEG